MSILFGLGRERELDSKLEELVTPIIQSIRVESEELEINEEVQEILRGLHVNRGSDPRDINAQCLRSPDGRTVLHIGQGLYGFICYYTRCVAAKMLPTSPGGSRPSPAWSAASSAMATALEWLALPVREVRFPPFGLSELQENRALIFGNMAYRAAICHELAHAVLGDLNAEEHERNADSEAGQWIREARERELQADVIAMRLHVDSLPHPDMVVTGLASVVYYIHATSLLRLKLMMLRNLIDAESWTTKGRHPDPLARVAYVVGAAKLPYGETLSQGLMRIHSDLDGVDTAIRQSHFDQQSAVHEEMDDLVRSLSAKDLRISTEGVSAQLQRLLDRSPVGVLEALDDLTPNVRFRAALATVVSALPRPFQRFQALASDHRAMRALNRMA